MSLRPISLHRRFLDPSTIASEPNRHDGLVPAMSLHRFLQEFQCCLLIACLGDDAFQHLTLVIDGAPKVVGHPIDLDENFIQVPLLVSASAHRFHTFAPNLGDLHQPKPVPPVPHGLMASLDAAFVQQIFDVAQRTRKSNVRFIARRMISRLVLK